jgi:hypothetical protein
MTIKSVGLQALVSVEMQDSFCESAFNPTYSASFKALGLRLRSARG